MITKFELNVSREKETFIIKALEKLSGPQRGWKFNTYSNGQQEIEWFDLGEGLQPEPLENVLAVAEELYAEWELTKYRILRSKEYPSIGDQLDALFKAGVFPEEMAEQIQAIKDKYPKPE